MTSLTRSTSDVAAVRGGLRLRLPSELIFQIFSLLIAGTLVHALYAAVVRPRAEAILAEQAARMQSERDYVPEQSFYVIIRDYEQESEIIFGLWAFAIMAYKAVEARRERRLLESVLLPIKTGMRILPEDTREYARSLEALPDDLRKLLLPRAMLAGLQRFAATRNIQDVSALAREMCQGEGERLESELSMIRYIAWAIPSLGFIGTVRGIGLALGQAQRAVDGNIAPVTENLGTAFNSTLIALLISMILMFLMHQLELAQERLVRDAQTALDRDLIQHLDTRGTREPA
jgi:biopolymer transport protein ExbB/TolQ